MTRSLQVTVKTGFRITNPDVPVIIRDCRGLLFYSTELQVPRVKEFNLPPGKYLVDSGYFTTMSEPVDYALKVLPPAERHRPIPHNFPIVWGENPNKCSIIWPRSVTGLPDSPKQGFILFDRSLEEYRLPELFFILYHEYSHASYKTEKFCDLKAYNYMILKGYNPAQIGMSQIDSLNGPTAKRRKQFLINVITNKKFDRK